MKVGDCMIDGGYVKVGDLVYCSHYMSLGINPSAVSGYGKITRIMDRKTGELFSEKKIITGRGDKNSRVNIEVRIITKKVDELWDPTSEIVLLETPYVGDYDPHDVIIISFNETKEKYKKTLKTMVNSFKFIRDNSMTREDKINLILKNEP